MATNTYVELDKVTISGTSTSVVTLNSISSAYTDLVVVISSAATATSTNNYMYMTFNNDATQTYSTNQIYGDGSNPGAIRWSNRSNINLEYPSYPSTTQSYHIINILSYSNTTSHKTILCRAGSANLGVDVTTGQWRSTAAISRIDITSNFSNFASGSTISLYGIKAEPEVIPVVTGGTLYSSDATYNYRVFTSSSDLTVTGGTLKADVLVVAGGGGGGRGERSGGGGGAGGMFELVSYYFVSGTHPIIIGSGGAKATGDNVSGTNGTNSSIGSYATLGGGAGAGYPGANTGGSGGGGSPWSISPSGKAGTSGQGNSGGDGNNASNGYNGGGGGGKAANGGSGASPVGGAGSASTYSGGAVTGVGQLSGGSYYFAGGGAGATQLNGSIPSVFAGGVGGGGSGSSCSFTVAGTAATNGTANTGGGGGGGGGSAGMSMAAGNGGSGIVVIRYAKA